MNDEHVFGKQCVGFPDDPTYGALVYFPGIRLSWLWYSPGKVDSTSGDNCGLQEVLGRTQECELKCA